MNAFKLIIIHYLLLFFSVFVPGIAPVNESTCLAPEVL